VDVFFLKHGVQLTQWRHCVSAGAVTDGVTLFFRHHSHPLRLPSDRFYSILCKFSHKNIDFHQGVTAGWYHPGLPLWRHWTDTLVLSQIEWQPLNIGD